jgi:hypothetical protein
VFEKNKRWATASAKRWNQTGLDHLLHGQPVGSIASVLAHRPTGLIGEVSERASSQYSVPFHSRQFVSPKTGPGASCSCGHDRAADGPACSASNNRARMYTHRYFACAKNAAWLLHHVSVRARVRRAFRKSGEVSQVGRKYVALLLADVVQHFALPRCSNLDKKMRCENGHFICHCAHAPVHAASHCVR